MHCHTGDAQPDQHSRNLETKWQASIPKDFFQVCHVLGYALRLDDHVIHIYFNISSDQLFKYSVNQSLVCSACIFKAKGHDPIAKIDIFSYECHFLLVLNVHLDLVVSRVSIQEA